METVERIVKIDYIIPILVAVLLVGVTISSTAQTRISGSLQGVLAADSYIVEDNAFVDEGQILTIEAGATLLFEATTSLEVNGTLIAVGTEEEPIEFNLLHAGARWRGIDFTRYSSTESRLEYCIVEGSNDWGIEINACNPQVRLCSISHNPGGGIYIDGSFSLVEDCLIEDNEASYGGGIFISYADPVIRNCIISNNTANYGGGIAVIFESTPTIENVVIIDNQANSSGGGIYSGESNPTIQYGVFTGNVSGSGGAMYFGYSEPSIINCTVAYNSATDEFAGGGIFMRYTSAKIVDTIVYGSTNYGAYFDDSPYCSVEYSDFFNNLEGNFGGTTPEGVGVIQMGQYNLNGDPCDEFFNILLDPVFVDPARRDFRLNYGSPCVNAGNPDPWFGLDPDGTTRDIGAIYHDIRPVKKDWLSTELPNSLEITAAYPNPFNTQVTLVFGLQSTAEVYGEVFDILGRSIARLSPGRLNPGFHRITWQPECSAGIYLIRLSTDDGQQAVSRVTYLK